MARKGNQLRYWSLAVLFIILPLAGFYSGTHYKKVSDLQKQSPSQEINHEYDYFKHPERIAKMFYQDFIQYMNARSAPLSDLPDYPFARSIFLTKNFINNHDNFMCAQNFPLYVTVDDTPPPILEGTAVVKIAHHYQREVISIEVTLIIDTLDGRWKILSTRCVST